MSSIFTKIISGELPARFVYRDDRVVAFLDIRPLTYGHTLVVPVTEVDKWTDLPQPELRSLTELAQQVGRAQIEAFGCERAGTVIAGFDVPHTHIHVFPANAMSDFNFSNAIAEPEEAKLDEAAAKLRAVLDTDDNGYPHR
ncbi:MULTISPECIES: HIT family protein [Corynebacterium]|uniref:HIT family protein n=1 Tax=Corynebacterium TaxID=1716 RepID=UPI00124DF4A4|nr:MULTISPECIES: HIT family protein [Corynebacterium]